VSIRVFLVEDVKQMQGVISDLLNVVGAFEIVARRATEAEANLWLDEHPDAWDLVLVDLILEQGTGMGVIPRAKKVAPHVPVIVLSDYATPGVREHCIRLGADAVFQKSQEMHAFMEYCGQLARPESERAEA
jgi:DNA-binding NarL/FixJ family response regulator